MESPGFVLHTLLHDHIDVFAYTSKILHQLIIRYSYHGHPSRPKDRRPSFIVLPSLIFKVLGAIELDDQICRCTIEIYNVVIDDLLAKESDWITS